LAGPELARVRFGISPVYETVMALAALIRPGVHAVHLPWARWARPRLQAVDNLDLLTALVGRENYKPGFLMPAPATRMPDLDTELRKVRATPPAYAAEATHPLPGRLARRFHDDPRTGLPKVTDALRHTYELVVAPHWDRMTRLLDADIAYRARELATNGFEGLFTDLHPDVVWTGDELIVHPRQSPSAIANILGHGLVLCPSVFCWPRVTAAVSSPTAGTLRYPTRGVATLWETTDPAPEALANLIGRTRAAILTQLASPQTTGGLATALGVTPGAVSQHLAVLKGAGLVATHREGRTTLHLRTAGANALLHGSRLS
jgi:DNA-binding transcriptional ArsR family regulator